MLHGLPGWTTSGRLVRGRALEPGTDEALVGKAVRRLLFGAGSPLNLKTPASVEGDTD